MDTEAVIEEMEKPRYYTVGELQALVAKQTGKPCNSRNRPALLRKLGLPDTPRPADLPKTGKAASAETLKRAVTDIAKAAKRPAPRQQTKPVAAPAITIRSAPERHAKALAYVRKAMARKSPPTLRALCEEMRKAKIQKPRGGTDWWPSSVQNLLRQIPEGK